MLSAARRLPPPWLFGITALPYGVYSGYLSTAMPYVLREAGVPLDRIAGISALTLAPAIWYFLWASVVAAMVFLPSLAALAIDEPEKIEPEKIASAPGQSMVELLRELGTMFRSRAGLIALAIFASPMGTAAAANLLSGLAVDYHAS